MNWIEYRMAEARNGATELDLGAWQGGSSDRLTEFPGEILEFNHLTKLNLGGHNLTTVPPEICKLENLQELDLSGNELVTLPAELDAMPKLSRLDLSYTRAGAEGPLRLPSTLQALDVSNAAGVTMTLRRPDAALSVISNLRNLREIGLDTLDSAVLTKLSSLPGLRSLSVRDRIEDGHLSFLATSLPIEELALMGGISREQIVEISHFHHVKSLTLRELVNFTIPAEWQKLPLEELHLRGDIREQTRTADLAGIDQFQNLRALSVASLPIRAGVDGIWGLRRLRELVLNGPLFTHFPERLFELDLQKLAFVDTSITKVPREIAKLAALTWLNLASNDVQTLPDEIGSLLKLRTLWLYRTNLAQIPDSTSELKSLEVVGLANTRFEKWPSNLNGLPEVERVDLQETKVTKIPAEAIRSLPRLKFLGLRGCNIEDPPPEIVQRGTAAIQGYFSALRDTPTARLHEAKLIIVGEGEVGKTCLAHKLVDPEFDITTHGNEVQTTRGIAVANWVAETEVAKDFKINIWDFGGQEIYHATHQFFLTKRSLYLFVWEARKEDRVEGFDYWLNVVKLLSQGSPVLIVQNKADVRIKEIDRAGLRKKFENIIGFHEVSARTGQGMAELARDVRSNIIKLPHVGDAWPQPWSTIRQRLVNDARNYMDCAEYIAMCEGSGLSKTQADLLSQYLHDLGVVLHFQDDDILRDTIILKPDWGTNAVYAVLDTKDVQRRRGRFSRSDLRKIWGNTDYPLAKHGELLQLMMRFELCFPLEGSQEYIAPELLSGEPPHFEWDSRNNLRFEYHYDFMPAGLMTRFIARNYAYIEGNCYWKNGVVLSWEGTRARVAADVLSRKVRVAVSGRDQKGMLAVVRRELGHINKTLNLADVPQMLPCTCSQCRHGEPSSSNTKGCFGIRPAAKQI